MKVIILFTLLIAISFTQFVPFNIWPAPQQWTNGSTTLTVMKTSSFFKATGVTSDILTQAMARYNEILFLGAPTDVDVDVRASDVTGCSVDVRTADVTLQLGFDESYTLAVTASGDCNIVSKTVYGALRGLETLAQLVDYDWDNNFMIQKAPITITDFPRYTHRGLLIDSSRHYLPVSTIYKVIDGMAFNKFNTLHWHLVDDQSFPYVSSTYPKLSEKGAFNPTRAIYTSQNVQDIITYAKYRGIRVMPEYDMPAHTDSWMEGYPTLQGSANCGFDPTLATTYHFIENFFKEIRSVYPDNYIHLGGDELSFKCWQTPKIESWMKQNNINSTAELESYFEKRILDLAKKHNIHPMLWQDIFNNGVRPSPEAVIEVWREDDYKTLKEVVEAGYQATMSGFWYLDHLGDTWQTYYSKDIDSANLTPEQSKLVIGGEACMWGEHVDHTNINQRVWPRASAVGEVLWSAEKYPKNADNALPRLHEWKCRMNRRGIDAAPVGRGNFCNPLSTI